MIHFGFLNSSLCRIDGEMMLFQIVSLISDFTALCRSQDIYIFLNISETR